MAFFLFVVPLRFRPEGRTDDTIRVKDKMLRFRKMAFASCSCFDTSARAERSVRPEVSKGELKSKVPFLNKYNTKLRSKQRGTVRVRTLNPRPSAGPASDFRQQPWLLSITELAFTDNGAHPRARHRGREPQEDGDTDYDQ